MGNLIETLNVIEFEGVWLKNKENFKAKEIFWFWKSLMKPEIEEKKEIFLSEKSLLYVQLFGFGFISKQKSVEKIFEEDSCWISIRISVCCLISIGRLIYNKIFWVNGVLITWGKGSARIQSKLRGKLVIFKDFS